MSVRKQVLKRVPLGSREVQIIRRLKKVIKLPVTKIALAVQRNKSSVYKALRPSFTPAKRGPKNKVTQKDMRFLARAVRAMVKKAAARYEVTLAMVMRRCKIKAGASTFRREMAKRKIYFRKMRQKPVLTKKDVKTRFAFAKKYRKKPKSFWQKKIDLSWDLKNFAVYVNAAGRAYAAQREVRGAYRPRGGGLGEGYVVAPKNLKYNTGAKPVRIAGGVGKGRLRVWHDVGRKWNAKVASAVYAGPVQAALKRASPRKRKFDIIEDNDPSGFKSKLAEKAKRAAKIKVLCLPKRSPDLSVMDYAIWKRIIQKMRSQERRFKKSKRETRAQFIARLRRTAKSLPPAFINKAVGNMKERCERLYNARGFHFEEGGKSLFVH